MQSARNVTSHELVSVKESPINKEECCNFAFKLIFKITEVVLIILGIGATAYFGYSSFQFNADIHSTVVWVFEAKQFLVALSSTVASLALGIHMIYSCVLQNS